MSQNMSQSMNQNMKQSTNWNLGQGMGQGAGRGVAPGAFGGGAGCGSLDSLMAQLNDEQRRAVEINDGALLVFAGAGSGKTRVITTKIAYAIEKLGIEPWRILAVTFTNKACKEMKDRVSSYVGEEKASQVMIRTFHSFGVWLLRKYGTKVGLDPNFKIYDDDDSVSLLAQYYPNANRKELSEAVKKISVLKDRMQKPNPLDRNMMDYYFKYEEALSRTGNVDFSDMILKSIKLLSENPDVKEYVHNRFRMILVDEYQDSNTAQFLLLKQIVGPSTFICAVGDDDQSIYRFRGAEVKNILDFPKVFEGTKKVFLGRNYRCTQSILAAANDVISRNETRVKKDLVAANKGGMKPQLFYVNGGYDEAAKVIEILKKAAVNDPKAYERSAVLYRTNSQSKDFEDRFMMNAIPYHIVGSLRFYDREEVRDCIALVSLIANPRDSVAFQRMVNKPARKVGDASIEKILAYSQNNPMMGGDIMYAARNASADGIVKGVASTGLSQFLTAYDACKAQFGVLPNGELLQNMLSSFGLLEYYTKRDKDEHNDVNKRTDNLNQLVNMLAMPEFCDGQDGINAFLEFASLDSSSLGSQTEGASNEGVTLITMHNTKGLEYDRVFMVGMEDEIFPGRRDDRTNDDVEEERRICYVAMTRARRELYLSCASMRMKWGSMQYETPSMFLNEIDPSHIDVVDLRTSRSKPASYGGAGGFGYGDWFGRSAKADYDEDSYRSDCSGYSDHSDYSDYGNKGGGFRQYGYGRSYGNGSGGGYGGGYGNGGWKKSQNGFEKQKPSGPKPSEAGKYNIRNKEGALAKSSVVLVKKAAKTAAAPGSVKFEVGDRIRSQFYGEGTVTGKRQFGGREVLDVKFDTGRTGTFATATAAFEKI